VLARATPEHKLRLIERLQAAGEVVAMTGDGVNDAPALKKADIGVAMGVRGVDAAKAAADMVLLDDDFSTIVAAMREGRRQDDNIRKFVQFLLAGNFGEVLAVCAGVVAGGPLILSPPQILWVNLVTDGATALALGLERAEPDVMARPPRPPDRSVLDAAAGRLTVAVGVCLGATTVAGFFLALPAGTVYAQTVAFCLLVVTQQGIVTSFRSFRSPMSRIGWASNPWLLGAIALALVMQAAAVYLWPVNAALGVAPLPFAAVGWILLVALPFVLVPEAIKAWRTRRR
jgi:Ca2+-transporting ATPase